MGNPQPSPRTVLAAQRERLVQRAQLQRLEFAHRALPLVHAATWADRCLAACRALQAHPWALLAPMAALALWRPRGVLRALPVLLALGRLVARAAGRA